MPNHFTELANELTVFAMHHLVLTISCEIFADIYPYIFLSDDCAAAYLVDAYVSRGMSELLDGKVMVKLYIYISSFLDSLWM